MALPGKRNEGRIEEHYAVADSKYRGEHPHEGHDFNQDLHPERYPRESLSRLDEGLLEDEQLRHIDDRLGYSGPDLEHRIDEARGLSRLLLVLGSLLLAFAGILLLWVGWDVGSGQSFFLTMWAVAVVMGLSLIGWGFLVRSRIASLLDPMARRRRGGFEDVARERGLIDDRAA